MVLITALYLKAYEKYNTRIKPNHVYFISHKCKYSNKSDQQITTHREECNVNAKYTDRPTSKEQQKTVSSNKDFYSFYL